VVKSEKLHKNLLIGTRVFVLIADGVLVLVPFVDGFSAHYTLTNEPLSATLLTLVYAVFFSIIPVLVFLYLFFGLHFRSKIFEIEKMIKDSKGDETPLQKLYPVIDRVHFFFLFLFLFRSQLSS